MILKGWKKSEGTAVKCKDCRFYVKWGSKNRCNEPTRVQDKRYRIYVSGNRKACKFFKQK